MPDDQPVSSHVSLRVPGDVVAAFDRLAAALDRPRSWVMLRALRQYLEDEGADIFEDLESIAELDRGEIVSSEEMWQRLEKTIAAARAAAAPEK